MFSFENHPGCFFQFKFFLIQTSVRLERFEEKVFLDRLEEKVRLQRFEEKSL